MSRTTATTVCWLKRCILPAAATMALVSLGATVRRHAHHAPYTVVETGERVAFEQIDKEHLGRLCSVFYKPGRPTEAVGVGREDPEGMVTRRGDVRIVTGELHAIGKDHLQIIAFWGETDTGGRWHHILADDMDYVLFKKETQGQPAAAP